MVSPPPRDLLTPSYVWHFAFLITTVTNEAFRGQKNKPCFGFATLLLFHRFFFFTSLLLHLTSSRGLLATVLTCSVLTWFQHDGSYRFCCFTAPSVPAQSLVALYFITVWWYISFPCHLKVYFCVKYGLPLLAIITFLVFFLVRYRCHDGKHNKVHY